MTHRDRTADARKGLAVLRQTAENRRAAGSPMGDVIARYADAIEAVLEHSAALEMRAALLDYIDDWVDGRDVLIRVSNSPDEWARDDHMWAEVDVRHWPDQHETASAALRRTRDAERIPE